MTKLIMCSQTLMNGKDCERKAKYKWIALLGGRNTSNMKTCTQHTPKKYRTKDNLI